MGCSWASLFRLFRVQMTTPLSAAASRPTASTSPAAPQAWRWQKDLVEEVCASSSSSAGEEPNSSSSSSAANGSSSAKSSAEPPSVGSLLLLQHPPVYTLGAGATEGHLKFDPAVPPHPLYRTERGGEVDGWAGKGAWGLSGAWLVCLV